MIRNVLEERSLVDFVFHAFMAWGINEILLRVPAARPISVI
jgi:hypothetical protein